MYALAYILFFKVIVPPAIWLPLKPGVARIVCRSVIRENAEKCANLFPVAWSGRACFFIDAIVPKNGPVSQHKIYTGADPDG